MTAEQIADYERAAVALESHMSFTLIRTKGVSVLARKVFDDTAKEMGYEAGDLVLAEVVCAVDNRAARLLRECIQRGEPLT